MSAARRSSRSRSVAKLGGTRNTKRAVAAFRAHLARALHLDLEQHVAPGGERRVDRRPARPVAVAVVHRPLEERARVDQALEFRRRHEVVVDPGLLARALRARGMRDRELDLRVARDHLAAHRGLARARGRRDHDRKPVRAVHDSSASDSPSSDAKRDAIVSGLIADRITWSLSVTMIERVRRPWVASTSLLPFAARSRRRFIGAAAGETIEITRDAITKFP
jgi:hypothetical protein